MTRLTPYRLKLLRRLPVHPNDTYAPERRQLNILCLAGYVDQAPPTNGEKRDYVITDLGRQAIALKPSEGR